MKSELEQQKPNMFLCVSDGSLMHVSSIHFWLQVDGLWWFVLLIILWGCFTLGTLQWIQLFTDCLVRTRKNGCQPSSITSQQPATVTREQNLMTHESTSNMPPPPPAPPLAAAPAGASLQLSSRARLWLDLILSCPSSFQQVVQGAIWQARLFRRPRFHCRHWCSPVFLAGKIRYLRIWECWKNLGYN